MTYKSKEYGKEKGTQLMNCISAQMNFGKKWMRQKESRVEGGEGNVSTEMIVAGQGNKKEGGEGNVSTEMKVASQDDDFLGDKVACTEFHDDETEGNVGTLEILVSQAIQHIEFNDEETKGNVGTPEILFSKVDDSVSAPLDVCILRARDVDTVCCKGAQTIKTDLNLPHEWVFSDPLGICEPVCVPKDEEEEGGDEVGGRKLVASPIISTKVDKSHVQHIAEEVNNEIGLIF